MILDKKEFSKKLKSKCMGVTNETEDGKRIIFLDYDNLHLTKVVEDINKIDKKFYLHLSFWIILKSSYLCYHAVNFAKVAPSIYEKIIKYSNCDDDFKNVKIGKKGLKVLRFSPKMKPFNNMQIIKPAPILMEFNNTNLLNCKECNNVILSKPHFEFYNLLYGIERIKKDEEIVKNSEFDFSNEIDLKTYFSYSE